MSRRTGRIVAAIASALTFSIVATSAITAEDTRAAWVDAEYVAGSVGTLDCALGSEQFASRAAGKLVSGQALGLDLDDIANLRGVDVQNSGTAVAVDPAPPIADPVGDDTFVNALDITALGAINVSLGNLLALPLDTTTGVLNHYAQAHNNGVSTGASGAVNDTGGIQLTPVAPGSQRPALATVQLGRLLSSITGQGLGGGIANLTDARLDVGAVSSRASLDACASAWEGDVYDTLAREYMVSSLGLNVDSPLVGNVVTGTQGLVTGVDTTLKGLAGPNGVVPALTTAVGALLDGVIGGLGLGAVSISDLAVTLDLSPVNALLDDTIHDSKNILAINLASGTVAIDLAGLLGSVYGTTGVNGLAPNTQLLVNAAVLNALVIAVTEALNDWVDDITLALKSVFDSLTVGAKVHVSLLGGTTPAVAIALTIPPSSVEDLRLGRVKATASVTLLGGECGPLGLPLLPCLVQGLLGGLLSTLTNGIGGTLGTVLHNLLFDSTGTGGLLRTTTTAVTNLTTPLLNFVGLATQGLFGENSVLSLSVNAQNRPNPALPSGTAVPRWASGLPGPDPAARTTGRYDVSALRLSTLGILGPNLAIDVDFARSSVGSNSVVR